MEVHHLLFIAWIIVFAFWIAGQFKKANHKYDQKQRRASSGD
jgi:hypothetical protein